MAKRDNGHSGHEVKVLKLSATCAGVGLDPAGGSRATLAVHIELEGPDGQRYRGVGTQLRLRVYPVRGRGTGKVKPKTPGKRRAAAAGA